MCHIQPASGYLRYNKCQQRRKFVKMWEILPSTSPRSQVVNFRSFFKRGGRGWARVLRCKICCSGAERSLNLKSRKKPFYVEKIWKKTQKKIQTRQKVKLLSVELLTGISARARGYEGFRSARAPFLAGIRGCRTRGNR